MKREDFMRQLERLLEGVAAEEKKEALSYYQSYFEDAGEENEERILKELESPEKVAATIKADLGMDGAAGQGEYTERGFEDSRFVQKNPIDIRKNTAGGRQGQPESQDSSRAGSSYGYSQGQPGTEGSYGYSQGASTGDGSQRYGSSGDSKAGGQGYGGAGRGSQNSYGNYSSNSGDGRSTYSGRSGMEILLIIIIAVVTSPVWIGVDWAGYRGRRGAAGHCHCRSVRGRFPFCCGVCAGWHRDWAIGNRQPSNWVCINRGGAFAVGGSSPCSHPLRLDVRQICPMGIKADRETLE